MNLNVPKTQLIRQNLARILWAIVNVLAVGVFLGSAPVRFTQLVQAAEENGAILEAVGLSVTTMAGYIAILDALTMLAFAFIALIIVWRRWSDPMALFVSATLMLIGVALTRPGNSMELIAPAVRLPATLAIALGTGSIILFMHIFPDGRFVPRWSGWLAILFTAAGTGWYLLPALFVRPAPWPLESLPALFAVGWLVSGLFTQVYRYIRVSSPEQRQQTKWVLVGFIAGGFGFLTFLYIAPALVPAVLEPGTVARVIYILLGVPFLYFSILMLPASIGISVLRYRLWDVDVLVNQTLVYAVLSLALGAIYFLSIVVLQEVFQGLVRESNELVIVLSTLIIAALFQPLRGRIQAGIDRRFYRQKYDTEQALAAFSTTLRDDDYADVDNLLRRLEEVLEATVAPEQVIICVRAGSGDHMVGMTTNMTLMLDDPLCDLLSETGDIMEADHIPPESSAAEGFQTAGVQLMVPIINQSELLAILALGPRRSGQEYSFDDRAMLTLLASQVGPALRVAQLVQQLEAEEQEHARVEQELQVARLIQQTLLPQDVPALDGWDIATHYQPAHAVGGDFYDFIPLPDGRIGFVIGDVSDVGVPAALMMASTRAVLRVAAQEHLAPNDVLAHTNDLLAPDMPRNMFVTCLYAILDPASGTLHYANAGHNLPFRWHDGIVEKLNATGVPIGLIPEMDYEARITELTPGELLLMFSDGLVEAHNVANELFGEPRLAALIRAQPANGTSEHAGQELIHRLLDELAHFTGTSDERHDDLTLVTLRRVATAED